ncbi:glycosyltransferase family A protein [Chelatococcus sp. SYSU_G07232]|uniref:Glycosyltransferase family A protein n=1 Tax=Chelatococcus albus TaxID=3047466 RepID=A0ABT7ADK8_9HYPH|nr:glycosyltransferase family A protein [Chelatococcus sp. SYSU_G07232]MDJ1157087.1 glycosyltransferase family A protein [Chelatococcus sp. SYSU_G07232]
MDGPAVELEAAPLQRPAPDISIVMSAYNERHWLPACIDAALAQTHASFEFLIVDDASTDSSRALLGRYDDPRLVIICRDTRNGWLNNVNALCAQAKGRLIKLMCPDDVMRPDCLERGWRFFCAHPEVGYIFTSHVDIDERGAPLETKPLFEGPPILSGAEADRVSFLKGCLMSTSGLFVPRERWREAGGMRDLSRRNPDRWPNVEDYELMVRLQERHPVGFIDEPLVEIRRHTQQVLKNPIAKSIFVETDLKVVTMLAERLARSKVLSEAEVRDRIMSKVADYMMTAAVFLRAGHWSTARMIVAHVFRTVPVHRWGLAWTWRQLMPYLARRARRLFAAGRHP